jgi:hypothetical protein
MGANQFGKMTVAEAKHVIALVNKHDGNKTAAAREEGVQPSTFKGRYAKAITLIRPSEKEAIISPEDALRDQVFELTTQLKSIRANSITDDWVKRKLLDLKKTCEDTPTPNWVIAGDAIKKDTKRPGVPVAFWSDWHWGEIVFPAQINGVNEFNLEIAHKRAKKLVERTIYLLRHHVVTPDFPGIVVNLGGDMMSGDIHEELTETNEQPLMPVLLDLFGVLRWALKELADEFGRVFVACVAGNHGRTTRKPRAKHRNFTNFDWLLYQFLAQSFENDDRITFYIPDGPDALYSVVGHRILLTHGDQFRGGDGMIGHFGPVLRGEKKKAARNSNIGLEFDTLIHGHFHTYFPTMSIIGNGSLKGYDEYANVSNFAYEPPIQALWLTHPEHGITIQMPVFLEPAAGKLVDPKGDWISWRNK